MKHQALTQPSHLASQQCFRSLEITITPATILWGEIDLPISPQLIEPHLILKAHPSLQISSD